MANLKQFVLVSAYLIALLLPLWHGAEAINYAWKFGEEWLKEKPVPDCAAGGCVTMGTFTTSGGGSGLVSTAADSCPQGATCTNGMVCQSGGVVDHGNGSYSQTFMCEETTNAPAVEYRITNSRTVTLPTKGCEAGEIMTSDAKGDVGCTAGTPNRVTFTSTPTFTTITIPEDDGWPNAKDCPFDKEKGARVCK